MRGWRQPSEKDLSRLLSDAITKVRPDIPLYAPDTRQEGFYRGIDQFRSAGRGKKVCVLPMDGWPASSPDLGRICDLIRDPVAAAHSQYGPCIAHEVAARLVAACVQRVKSVSGFPNHARSCIQVWFLTEDDFGVYEFRFGFPINNGEDKERRTR